MGLLYLYLYTVYYDWQSNICCGATCEVENNKLASAIHPFFSVG